MGTSETGEYLTWKNWAFKIQSVTGGAQKYPLT